MASQQEMFREVISAINLDLRTSPRQDITDPLKYDLPGSEQESWKKCSDIIDNYDNGLCEAYREQIDTLLVFAGLFSAVITAFTIESYQWLVEDSGDVTVHLLAQIVSILNETGTGDQPHPTPSTSLLPDPAAARINVYWFLSLVMSLSAALVGIVTKQWIREYDRDAGRTHPESIGVRQMKFKGLDAWRVSEIVSSVPLLLQLSLFLFFAGVMELLWNLDVSVAVPVTLVVSLTLTFYLATTILPAIFLLIWYRTPDSDAAQCPYKSPQAWLFLRGVLRLISRSPPRKLSELSAAHVNHMHTPLFRHGYSHDMVRRAGEALRRSSSWIAFDLAWSALSDAEPSIRRPEHRFEALSWLKKTVDHSDLHAWVWHCVLGSWRSPLGYRSTANILECLPVKDRTLGPGGPIEHLYGPLDQAKHLLFPYAATAAGMPPFLAVELLCRTFTAAWTWELWPVGDDNEDLTGAWLEYWMAKLPCIAENMFPDDLQDALIRAFHIYGRTPWPFNSRFGKVVHSVLLSLPIQARWQASLCLGLCALVRHWLLRGAGQLDELERKRRVQIGWDVLLAAVERLGHFQHVLAGPEESVDTHWRYKVTGGPADAGPITLVFARLAKTIEDLSRGPEKPPVEWFTEDEFRKLVEIATVVDDDAGSERALDVPNAPSPAGPADDSQPTPVPGVAAQIHTDASSETGTDSQHTPAGPDASSALPPCARDAALPLSGEPAHETRENEGPCSFPSQCLPPKTAPTEVGYVFPPRDALHGTGGPVTVKVTGSEQLGEHGPHGERVPAYGGDRAPAGSPGGCTPAPIAAVGGRGRTAQKAEKGVRWVGERRGSVDLEKGGMDESDGGTSTATETNDPDGLSV